MAFYCATKVASRRANFYRSEPLRSCERDALAESHIVIEKNLVLPAPLPPYAFAFFSLFLPLSYHTAALAFLLVSIASIAAAAVLLMKITSLHPILVAIPIVVATVGASIPIGQAIPVVLAAACACAYALRAQRLTLATAFLGLTTIEPHIALPVIVALFSFLPTMRFRLIALCVVLLGLSLTVASPAINLEYVVSVLPDHARSEVANFFAQYSATSLAWRLGANVPTSLWIGELSYVAMLAFGLFAARRLVLRTGDVAFYVFTPAAMALLGGLYAHIQLMALGLPCALLLIAYARGFSKIGLFGATALLAIPWQSLFEMYFSAFYPHRFIDPAGALAAVSGAQLSAEQVWTVWVRAMADRDLRSLPQVLAFKLPTWSALVAIAIVALRIKAKGRDHPPVNA